MKNRTEPYFANEVIERALALQAQSYQFLLWMAELERCRINNGISHGFSQLSEASHNWIETNYEVIPTRLTPSRDDITAFSNLFATYIESSFDLVESPGQRLYSDNAHCFCPICSWLVEIPHLQPKKVAPFDKRRAKKLQREFVRNLASTMSLDSDASEKVLSDESLREDIALGTWIAQLLRRLEGMTPGPAVLALWRIFAWTRTGSPKKKFSVTSEMVEQSMERLREALRAMKYS